MREASSVPKAGTRLRNFISSGRRSALPSQGPTVLRKQRRYYTSFPLAANIVRAFILCGMLYHLSLSAHRVRLLGRNRFVLYGIGSPLPEYRVKAYKSGGETCNLVYDDAHARRFGFRAGLVPGVSIYAYMSRSLVEFAGRDWLERGAAEVAFHHPAYDGEEIKVTGALASVAKDGSLSFDIRAENPQGMVCALGTGRLPPQPPQPEPDMEVYPDGERRLRRPISLASLKAGARLTAVTTEFNRKTHWEYCEKTVRDHHPIYHQLAHPGWILAQADLIFTANFDLPPWIHVSSAVQNYRAQEQECLVETRGRVLEKFELRGNHYVVLEVAVFANSHCLASIRHTAIFRIAPLVA
jgi:hypothetical protein